jgi:hypothetical protein
MANSNLVQAAVTIQGTIEASNKGGVKIAGAWYNYPRGFPNEGKLSREVVGALVTLAVFCGDGDAKPVIGSVLKLEKPEGVPSEKPAPASAPIAPAPAAEMEPVVPVAQAPAPEASPAPAAPSVPSWTADPASGGQKEKIAQLSESLGLSSQTVNLILKMRYKDEQKSTASLTKGEASRLISFLESQAPTLPARGRSA